jgi:hypothetical protein
LRWFAESIALLITYIYLLSMVQAMSLLAFSSDGSIGAGWGGHPIAQVLGWAMFGGWFAAFAAPLVAVVLLPYRVIVHVAGHPRLIALAIGSLAAIGCVIALQDVEPSTLLVIAALILGYAAIIRIPGDDLTSLPRWLSGTIVGLALSAIWLIGSIAGIALGAYRASRGDALEGGAIAFASTAVPGAMLFADLFRDSVPVGNYVIVAMLLGGIALSVWLLLKSQRPHPPERRRPKSPSRRSGGRATLASITAGPAGPSSRTNPPS